MTKAELAATYGRSLAELRVRALRAMALRSRRRVAHAVPILLEERQVFEAR